MLLLNYEEEPKYDYLIDELKKAYTMIAMEAGEKPNPQVFKTPVFDWNVSLATRFQKILNSMEDHWQEGEANIGMHNLSLLNKTLLKSRMNFNLQNHGSSSHDSHGSNAFASPMSSNDFGMAVGGNLGASNHNSKEV